MLKDKKLMVERWAANRRLFRAVVVQYAAFLRTLFSIGDWFVTLTFRDRHQDSWKANKLPVKSYVVKRTNKVFTACPPDPRLTSWEPDSKNRPKPGPPVRDAALREIEHWLVELGWEAAGCTRQEIFNYLADGLYGNERQTFAKRICRRCLCCALLDDPVTLHHYFEIRKVATATIGWVIAEEFGRAGGRWHVHLLIQGVQHLRRKKWWKHAFVRFGRCRIEPIHE